MFVQKDNSGVNGLKSQYSTETMLLSQPIHSNQLPDIDCCHKFQQVQEGRNLLSYKDEDQQATDRNSPQVIQKI